jgi:DNA-binding NtrC family response regulator
MDNAQHISDLWKASRASLRRKRVLVVDDDSGFRELIASILCQAGYQVDGAADGSEAMSFVAKSQIDLLITDIVMPNREGIETIQYFSKLVPKVPVVAVSGNGRYLRSAKALGAVATMEKTAVVTDLLRIVRSVIEE